MHQTACLSLSLLSRERKISHFWGFPSSKCPSCGSFPLETEYFPEEVDQLCKSTVKRLCFHLEISRWPWHWIIFASHGPSFFRNRSFSLYLGTLSPASLAVRGRCMGKWWPLRHKLKYYVEIFQDLPKFF